MGLRIVKEAEERKNEILDVAEKLFSTNGYDQTSTNDILKEIGIARGTLYYHFESKEAILDAIIERMTSRLVAKAAAVAKQEEIPVIQRVIMAIQSLNVDSELGQEVMAQVHKPQNALMHQKMQEVLLNSVNPIITGLIEEAVKAGICDTEYPEEAVEMFMIYANVAFDDNKQNSKDEEYRKMIAYIYHVERILGMKKDALLEVIMPLFQVGNE